MSREKKGIYIKCNICGIEFYIYPSEINKRKYCSNKCEYKARKQIERLQYSINNIKGIKKKITKYTNCKKCNKIIPKWNNRNINNYCYNCIIEKKQQLGIIKNKYKNNIKIRTKIIKYCINCNSILSIKTRKYCNNCKLEMKNKSNIIEILRKSKIYKNWQLNICKRDKGICNICNKKCRKDITVHHIEKFKNLVYEALKEYPLLNKFEACEIYKPLWDLKNGIVLCRKCHGKIHSKEGHHKRWWDFPHAELKV